MNVLHYICSRIHRIKTPEKMVVTASKVADTWKNIKHVIL